jgi:effector-binding domain-containing protein
MKKKLIVLLLSIFVLGEIVCIAGFCLCKGQNKNCTDISTREIPQQTVLYTIYRGKHHDIGRAINQLNALAKEKGITKTGPVSTCHLNSPVAEQGSHRLIEIQIPVEDIAIDQAGTLGFMTDIKKVPAMKVAVAQKPQGYHDPTRIIADLFTWINKKGYVARGRMRQLIHDGDKGNYEKLRTEFIIPIDEISDDSFPTLMMNPCYM